MNPNFQSTPIKIGDRLYTSTNLGQAAALDPVTGEELWRYDPYASGLRDVIGGRSNRGVAYWSDGTSERVFLASGEYLVSLDAATGLSDEAFGNGGAVDLAADEGTEGALSILPIAGGENLPRGGQGERRGRLGDGDGRRHVGSADDVSLQRPAVQRSRDRRPRHAGTAGSRSRCRWSATNVWRPARSCS